MRYLTGSICVRAACGLAIAAALTCIFIVPRAPAAAVNLGTIVGTTVGTAVGTNAQRSCTAIPLSAIEGSALSAALSGADSASGAALFRAGAETLFWSGSLTRSALSVAAGESAQAVAESEEWEAGAILDGSDFQQRHIYTAINTPGSALQTVAFSWPSLAAAQHAVLGRDSNGIADGLGSLRLDYLRGDRSRELGRAGGIFRQRGGVLGDIVHSLPVVVGAPGDSISDQQYRQFYNNYRGRVPAVYVGANDGMLHAFRATDGVELFAYIPALLFERLPLLTRPDYVHQAYVDGLIGVGEAQLAGRWRSVLAAGMGAGAGGVFALDVSDPGHFADGDGALFEFGAADDADMGLQFGAPAMSRLRDADGVLRDFLVVAGGYRHSERASAGSALFLLSLDKRPADAWRLGYNYFKFEVPASPVAGSADGLNAGLSTPVLVPGDDGVLRYVYAGDLQGNLWRFDLAGRAPWPAAAPAAPIFVARDGNGKRQPIAQQPQVVFAAAFGGGYMVLFGTGKLLDDSDVQSADFSPQSFYGVLDALQAPQAYQRADLQPRTFSAQGTAFAIAGPTLTIGAGGRNHGWYFDFPSAGDGERSVSSALLVGQTLLFNTVWFDSTCALASRIYVLSTLSGLTTDETGGTTPASLLSASVGEGAARLILLRLPAAGPTATAQSPRSLLLNAAAGDLVSMAVPDEAAVLRTGRLEWREISNWQERRAAALK